MIRMPPPIPGSVGYQLDLDGGLVLAPPNFPQADHRGVLARCDEVSRRLQAAIDMAQGAQALRARAAIALALLDVGLLRGEVGQVITELLELRVDLARAGDGANDNGGQHAPL